MSTKEVIKVYKLILQKEWRSMRWIMILSFFIALGTVLTTGIMYYYTEQFIEEIPPELFSLLKEHRLSRSFLGLFEDFNTYVWSQWNGKNLLQLGSLLSIVLAALQFAGEKSKKTMSFFLSRPLSRKEGYIGKILAGALFLFFLFGLSTLFLYLVSIFMGHGEGFGRLLGATLLSLLWLSVFYLMCVIVSIKANEPIPAGAIMGGGALLLSALGLFPATQSYSLFYQISARGYFLREASFIGSLLPGIVVGAIVFKLGLYLFLRQDY